MSKKRFGTAIPRLQQDYLNLKKDPVPYIRAAEPNPSDMLEWHYVIQGPEDSAYAGGYYHGILIFTQQYPFKPPSIFMYTPNGRFETRRRLCLSISDYHPEEWNPAWGVSSILTGLLSFMLENSKALGTIETLNHEKVKYAKQSLEFNLKDEMFCSLFPEVCEEMKGKLRQQRENDKTTVVKGPAVEVKPVTSTDSNESSLIFIICVCIVGLITYHFCGHLLTD
ncbi:hypothetical protein HA402_009614 [Bradysia odoriphaga]|nr:hypothetical protein HA402_009614 [Bradysia odoriphaga]